MRVLFVCTGNICRSPTAEGVFRNLVHQAGLQSLFEIDSCGMINYHKGEQADPRTRAVANSRGFTIDDLRARQIRDRDYQHYDLLLAMDQSHLDQMREAAPQASDKLKLFLSYDPSLPQEVPDPYYGGPDGFDHVFDLVEKGARALLDGLHQPKG